MTTDVPSPSAAAHELHRVPEEEALAFVDHHLGPASSWPSPLIAYRMASDFQADWKAELGQWLKAAEQFGFLSQVLNCIASDAKRHSKKHTAEIDPNDEKHLKLHACVAPAQIIHYLTATGWSYSGYETKTGGSVDIDCALFAPDDHLVEFQVKSPDQPGRLVAHHYEDGDIDERVISALEKARKQLQPSPAGPRMIGICANRSWPLAWEPRCVVRHVVGSTMQIGKKVYLERHNRGFFSPDWCHVSAILLLDLIRGELGAQYTCTVITNPWATFPVSPDWFQRARVCVLEGDAFRWIRGKPGMGHGLVNGTQLVDQLPI